MKRVLFLLLSLWLFVAANTSVASVDVGININIGAPAVVIESPPEFLLIPSLGLHISIGAPYDLIYLDSHYYHFHNNRWYRSNHYQGPWNYVDRDHLPKRIQKHQYREMLDRRNQEYKNYKKDPEHHRDRYYRPDDKRGNKEGRGNDDHKGNNKGNKGKHGGKD